MQSGQFCIANFQAFFKYECDMFPCRTIVMVSQHAFFAWDSARRCLYSADFKLNSYLIPSRFSFNSVPEHVNDDKPAANLIVVSPSLLHLIGTDTADIFMEYDCSVPVNIRTQILVADGEFVTHGPV